MNTTAVMQEYLAETYRIASYQNSAYVSTSDLAERMNKTAPAVVRMASRLKEMDLIEHEPYQGIRLTSTGEHQALLYIRRHRIVEVFLVQVMDFGWEEVHEEAEALGAVISDTLLDRMDEMINFPQRCPHGEPIPTRDGVMPALVDYPLPTLEPPQALVVSRVNTHDPEKLHYLREICLIPGQEIELISRAPFNGPLRLKIGQDEQVIGMELAHALQVCERGQFEI